MHACAGGIARARRGCATARRVNAQEPRAPCLRMAAWREAQVLRAHRARSLAPIVLSSQGCATVKRELQAEVQRGVDLTDEVRGFKGGGPSLPGPSLMQRGVDLTDEVRG